MKQLNLAKDLMQRVNSCISPSVALLLLFCQAAKAETPLKLLSVPEGRLLVAVGGGTMSPISSLLDTNLPFGFLTPVIDGTNIILTLTNADSSIAYDLYFNPVVTTNFMTHPGTTLAVTGRLGQITFTNPIRSATGFFKAATNGDWDGDGSPNNMDADPRNPAVSNLTVTIDVPTTNAVLY